ncbi:hypothetical protein FN846DRAFT_239220 [Sphaerosporella brunnea]|uniref:Uncharacterized protein n=1 Tax=Sphaerosporella brunnea TaxID=1250544 RepID=A0A5J5FBN1_9PEZI|nr:hypothetical protein FN846DRAFT_239220 [Sphaerosporella brunnea]
MLWDVIGRLVDAEVHVDLALALWLRWITATSENVKPSQKILGSDRYWALIQKCLVTGFSERKKYSLYLLTTSVSLLQEPFNARTFAFDPKKSAPIIAAWDKYTTFVEIVSLSASPNQLRDATSDLKRLLDPTSYIPASWIAVLITLGFQSGSGGVARAFWNIVTSLEKKRLARLFEGPEGRKLLQDVLLPYAASASNFVIGRSTPEKCAHGTHIAKWVGSVLSSEDAEAQKATARAVLEWIDEKEDNSFAPARVWILQGVLIGVEGEKVFTETRDLALLVKIAKMRRFTKLKVDVCVAIVLKLFLAIDVEKVGFEAFWR